MTATEKIIDQMLRENTGTNMLDSGGVYGRSWERNQNRNFADEPEAVLDEWGGVTINLYHWLVDRLEYDFVIDKAMEKWGCTEARIDDPWLEVLNEFPEEIESIGFQIGGIYGEGDPFIINTYNGEDALSQVILYHFGTLTEGVLHGSKTSLQAALSKEIDGRPFVILSIHGGCDVRGGYTQPRFFWLSGEDGTDIFNNAQLTLECCQCNARWDTENAGYRWEGIDSYCPDTDQLPLPDVKVPDYFMPDDIGGDAELVNENKDRVCPHCRALNTLEVYPWPCC